MSSPTVLCTEKIILITLEHYSRKHEIQIFNHPDPRSHKSRPAHIQEILTMPKDSHKDRQTGMKDFEESAQL